MLSNNIPKLFSLTNLAVLSYELEITIYSSSCSEDNKKYHYKQRRNIIMTYLIKSDSNICDKE